MVSAAWTEEVTALAGTIKAPGSCNCVSACRRGWGRRGKGGNAPPPRHVQIDRVKDTFSWRHSQTDTHRPGKSTQRQSGASKRQLDRHTRQTATARGAVPEGGKQGLPLSCSHTSVGLGEDRSPVPAMGGAWETAAEAADWTPILTAVSGSSGDHPSHWPPAVLQKL